jgi:hypothetical protein
MIIAATLMAVAVTARRIINLEKEGCVLKMIRREMKKEVFKSLGQFFSKEMKLKQRRFIIKAGAGHGIIVMPLQVKAAANYPIL